MATSSTTTPNASATAKPKSAAPSATKKAPSRVAAAPKKPVGAPAAAKSAESKPAASGTPATGDKPKKSVAKPKKPNDQDGEQDQDADDEDQEDPSQDPQQDPSQEPQQPDQPPQDPSQPPGPDWVWKGKGEPGSQQGAWVKEKTGESLHIDRTHHGREHWDYVDPQGKEWRIRIEVDAPADCPPVLADAAQLESALLNIAINARDAMPDGGLLWFACREVPARSPDLPRELAEAEGGAYVAIAVGDTGSGMSEEVKERAFEPFFTTKEAGRGTGLGLATVYGFAKQSKGAVTLDSSAGKGTTITLFLPGEAQAAGIEAEPEKLAALPPGLRVLLVEDDAEVRSVAQRFLVSLGCTVLACASGEQARHELRPEAGLDLLITDIALGSGMRGTELAELARAQLPGLPVLLMSGYASALLDSPPGRDLLRKPYTRAELGRAMARALAAGKN